MEQPFESSYQPHANRRKYRWLKIGIVVLVFIFVCHKIERSIVLRPSFLVGVYEGNYEGGQETIELLENRTYRQVFVKDGKQLYDNSGFWEIRNGAVFLDRFINVFWIRWDNVKDLTPEHGEALEVTVGGGSSVFFRGNGILR